MGKFTTAKILKEIPLFIGMPTLIKRFETKSNVYQQFKCECGGQYYSNKKYRHLKTIKHNDYLKDIRKNVRNFDQVLKELKNLV